MDRQILLSRIQNLLNKTVQNGATEAEAATFMAAAQRLMDEHNIALAEVVSRSADDSIFAQSDAWTADTAHSHFVSCLPIVEHVFVVKTIVWKTVHKGSRSTFIIKVFGDPTNTENATWAINFLGPIFRRLWDSYRVRNKAKTSEMQGYYFGLVDGFMAKLEQQRADDRRLQIGSSHALALLSSRLDQAFATAFPQLAQIVKQAECGDAYGQGLKDGADINLARSSEKSEPRAIGAGRKAIGA